MFDSYNNIIILKRKKDLKKVLTGIKMDNIDKIFISKRIKNVTHSDNDFRIRELRLIYNSKKLKKNIFLTKENGYYLVGDLGKVFYSPRYQYDRQDLAQILSKNLTDCNNTLKIIGSGIGPYAMYLAKLFKKIYCIDINKKALAYSKINCALNNISNVEHIKTDLEEALKLNTDYTLVMIPNHKNIVEKITSNFTNVNRLIIYIRENIEDISNKYFTFNKKCIRNYSKTEAIFRLMN